MQSKENVTLQFIPITYQRTRTYLFMLHSLPLSEYLLHKGCRYIEGLIYIPSRLAASSVMFTDLVLSEVASVDQEASASCDSHA